MCVSILFVAETWKKEKYENESKGALFFSFFIFIIYWTWNCVFLCERIIVTMLSNSRWTLFVLSNFWATKLNQFAQLKPKGQLFGNGGFRRGMLFSEVWSFFFFLRLALLPLQMRPQRKRRSSGPLRSHSFSLLRWHHFRQGQLLLFLFPSMSLCFVHYGKSSLWCVATTRCSVE